MKRATSFKTTILSPTVSPTFRGIPTRLNATLPSSQHFPAIERFCDDVKCTIIEVLNNVLVCNIAIFSSPISSQHGERDDSKAVEGAVPQG
jgi:hypothetical protein